MSTDWWLSFTSYLCLAGLCFHPGVRARCSRKCPIDATLTASTFHPASSSRLRHLLTTQVVDRSGIGWRSYRAHPRISLFSLSRSHITSTSENEVLVSRSHIIMWRSPLLWVV
ncbi:hypothetical protein BJY52DRAFT_1298649 [Lactarius psammicola]|nr:hypothetical protein BJY52DRAFT_1298649 [Lactarius psammicola]